MPGYFLDSSALVKRYVEEPGTGRVLELLSPARRLIVSRLATVEVSSAIVRRARRIGLRDEEVEPVLDALESEVRERFEVVELGTPVLTRAIDLVRVHALRAADAIQLACALIARGEPTTGADFALVSSDAELNAAAQQESLAVIDPAQE